MNRAQALIWLAGFFDGEGSLVGTSQSPTIYVYQKDMRVLRKIQTWFGGRVRNQKYKATVLQPARTVGRIYWRGTDAIRMLTRLRPYIQTRKIKQIDEILGLT